MSGTQAAPIGITNPPIDDLLTAADSKYALVIYSAKRARQINAYYSQLQEGLLDYVGPLVETEVHTSVLTGLPERADHVGAPTKWSAAAVGTTVTSWPFSVKRRSRDAAL